MVFICLAENSSNLRGRFELLATVPLTTAVLRDLTTCRLATMHRRFVAMYSLHFHGRIIRTCTLKITTFLENVATYLPDGTLLYFRRRPFFVFYSLKHPTIPCRFVMKWGTSNMGPVRKTHALRIHVNDPRRCNVSRCVTYSLVNILAPKFFLILAHPVYKM